MQNLFEATLKNPGGLFAGHIALDGGNDWEHGRAVVAKIHSFGETSMV